MDNGHWDAPFQMGSEDYIGFIYLIVNLNSGRCYLGKKLYKRGGKKTVKRNGKRVPNPSLGKPTDWKKYKSSCNELIEDIKTLKENSFDFYCIAEFSEKRDLHYAEVKYIMEYDMLISDSFYNNHCPDIYCIPPCQKSRSRREKIKTLINRSLKK